MVGRRYSDLELAQRAKAAGMRAIVLKSHVESTVGRAALASEATGLAAYGGIVLNPFVTGGLDPDVVEVSLALGARVVWLPSLGSAAHRAAFGRRGRSWASVRGHPAQIPTTAGGVEIDPADRAVRDTLRAICREIARSDALLASGHTAADSIGAIARVARGSGARFLVTHPDYAVPSLTIAEQVSLVREFPEVALERSAFVASRGWRGRVPVGYVVEAVHATGVDRNVVSSDLGQPGSPPYPAGLASFARALMAAGLSQADLRHMLVTGPARLLGLNGI